MRQQLIASLLAAALAACASQWHKAGGTQGEYEQTLSACQLEAQRAVPAAPEYAVAAGTSYTTTKCKDNACTEYSTFIPSSINSYDANTDQRDQYVRACLFRNGWSDQS